MGRDIQRRWVRLGRSLASDPLYLVAWLVVAGVFVAPVQHWGRLPVLCPFRLASGLPCPGCGLTRSFSALAHLDPGAAFAHHPFGPLLLVSMVVALVLKPTGERLDAWLTRLWRTHRWARRGLLGVAAAWLAWAVIRAATTAWPT